ncbi:hypothetical protein B0H10DRAFT_1951234 [Mycena sp. CBHHK59/15]|nr:hypothetical protein B0H10DRAFT_1951234 [Mycena sp. CBHHK59/15]
MANPWILPSVNKFLSKISNNNWDITPNHSNLVETAHAGRNAETAIGVALLTGIMQFVFHANCLSQFSVLNRAQERDNIIAGELNRLDQNGVMRHRFNRSAEREKLSAQRKVWNMRKTAARNDHITGYEELKAERENGLLENKASLEREGTLQAQVKSLWDAIQLDKRRTDLKEQLNEVRTEIEQEKSGRREWVLRRAELDRQINELRSGPLAGTRINGRHPTERPTGRSNLWLPQLKMSHGTRWMKEWWMIRVCLTAFTVLFNGIDLITDFGTTVQMEPEEPEYQLEYAGPRYEGNPIPAAEYEEPVNELEYAGPISEADSGTFVPQEFVFNGTISPQVLIDGRSSFHETESPLNSLLDSFGVPMEYPSNLDAGPVDFPSDVLVNPIESTAGLDDFNMEDFFPNFDPQAFDFGSTYDLPRYLHPSILPSHTSGHGRDAINPEAQNEGAGGRCTRHHS